MTYFVVLSASGIPRRVERVASLEEASEACLTFIEKNDLGSGTWSGGKVVDERDVVVARISYNGRIWPVQL